MNNYQKPSLTNKTTDQMIHFIPLDLNKENTTSMNIRYSVSRTPIAYLPPAFAAIVLWNKGLDVEIEVIDDTNVTPPTILNTVSLVTPYGTANMILVANKANQARKREGMRTFTFKSFNAIAGLH